MEIGQALGSFSIEPSSPSFHSVIPCRQRDILYLLHDNGSISMRAVRSPSAVPYQTDDDPNIMLVNRISLDIVYDIKCHSDVFRLSRASRLMGFCLDPVTECQTAIILGDGRILFWSLAPPAGAKSFRKEVVGFNSLPSLQESAKAVENNNQFSLDKIVPPLLAFGDDKEKQLYHKPKFLLNGIFEGLSLNPICARMCPPMTTKNFGDYKPYLAVGMSFSGSEILVILQSF